MKGLSKPTQPGVRFVMALALLLAMAPTSALADGTFAFQSTEVWVRRGDSWKLVHLHYSPVEEKR